MGLIGCPEAYVRNYYYSLGNNPEYRSYHLLRGGSLMSRIAVLVRRAAGLHAFLYLQTEAGTASLTLDNGQIPIQKRMSPNRFAVIRALES